MTQKFSDALNWLYEHITSDEVPDWRAEPVYGYVGPDVPFVTYTALVFTFGGKELHTSVEMISASREMWHVLLHDLNTYLNVPIRFEYATAPMVEPVFFNPIGLAWPERGKSIYHVSAQALPPEFAIPGRLHSNVEGIFILRQGINGLLGIPFFYWEKQSA